MDWYIDQYANEMYGENFSQLSMDEQENVEYRTDIRVYVEILREDDPELLETLERALDECTFSDSDSEGS